MTSRRTAMVLREVFKVELKFDYTLTKDLVYVSGFRKLHGVVVFNHSFTGFELNRYMRMPNSAKRRSVKPVRLIELVHISPPYAG
jgi:hypothetical protein